VSHGGVAAAVLVMLALGVPAQAQYVGRADPGFGTWEVAGGAATAGGYDLGSRSADQTRNPGTATGGFSLFQSSSEVTRANGASARIGFYLSRALALEAGGHYTRPRVSTRVSGDAEEAAPETVEETLSRVVVDGTLVYHLVPLTFAGGRGVPFLAGGAGYLREIHEGNELIETGREYHAGAGLKYWFGLGGRRLGLRADVAASIRDGAFFFTQKRRTTATAGIGLSYLF
jgi:hypothetical protein